MTWAGDSRSVKADEPVDDRGMARERAPWRVLTSPVRPIVWKASKRHGRRISVGRLFQRSREVWLLA